MLNVPVNNFSVVSDFLLDEPVLSRRYSVLLNKQSDSGETFNGLFNYYELVCYMKNRVDPEKITKPCTDPESFARGDPILTLSFVFFDEGREDPNSTKIGPSSARQ